MNIRDRVRELRRPFRGNRLIRRPDAVLPDGPNEYGMKLRQLAVKE